MSNKEILRTSKSYTPPVCLEFQWRNCETVPFGCFFDEDTPKSNTKPRSFNKLEGARRLDFCYVTLRRIDRVYPQADPLTSKI